MFCDRGGQDQNEVWLYGYREDKEFHKYGRQAVMIKTEKLKV